MRLFLHKNFYKISSLVFLSILILGLASCRTDANYWYSNAYTTWGAEFHFRTFWDGFFGWSISVLSYPIAWLFSNIGKLLGNSYFFAIIFTTIIVRTIAWPIYSRQNGMSLKMQLMQPEIDRIQKKYQYRQDEASKMKMNQEMQAIYKKYKINPFGCLFTMFLQFPIFMAMYEVVRRVNATTTVVENGLVIQYYGKFALENTKLFGFFELSNSSFSSPAIQDKLFNIFITIVYVGVTYCSQRLSQRKPSYMRKTTYNNQATDQQKQMKTMNIVMLVMFGFIALSNTALAIYWLVGGIYQIIQSQVGRINNEKAYYKHNGMDYHKIKAEQKAERAHLKEVKKAEKAKKKANNDVSGGFGQISLKDDKSSTDNKKNQE